MKELWFNSTGSHQLRKAGDGGDARIPGHWRAMAAVHEAKLAGWQTGEAELTCAVLGREGEGAHDTRQVG